MPSPYSDFRFPNQEKCFAHSDSTLPGQEQPLPCWKFEIPDWERRFPCWDFTFSDQKKRFPCSEFALANASGKVITWDIEANSLSILRRTDATPDNLKVGDTI